MQGEEACKASRNSTVAAAVAPANLRIVVAAVSFSTVILVLEGMGMAGVDPGSRDKDMKFVGGVWVGAKE